MPPQDPRFPASYTPPVPPPAAASMPAQGVTPPPVPPSFTTPPQAPAAPVLPATFLRRLANHLLDGLTVGIIGSILMFVVSTLLGTTKDAAARSFDFSALIAYGSLSMIVPFLYYLTLESVWGRTIGKLATDTKVVDYTGAKPSFGRVFLRSICRHIPFESFSFLFKSYPRGWHDKISETLVVPNSANPEAVAGMDRAAADKTKGPDRWTVVLISVLGVLQLLAIPFFIFIFWLAVKQLNTNLMSPPADSARSEMMDSVTRSALAGLATDSLLYQDSSANYSYEGFCTDDGMFGAGRTIERLSVRVMCNDSEKAWAASAPVTGGYWCADSSGFASSSLRALGTGEVSCPQ